MQEVVRMQMQTLDKLRAVDRLEKRLELSVSELARQAELQATAAPDDSQDASAVPEPLPTAPATGIVASTSQLDMLMKEGSGVEKTVD